MAALRRSSLLLLTCMLALPARAAVDPPRAPWVDVASPSIRPVADDAFRATQAIAQDREGFVWVGTSHGLFRWDGHRARVAPSGPADGALGDDDVVGLATDRAGTLWVGTRTGGLFRRDDATDRFVRIAAIGGPTVSAIVDDGAGGLWVGTAAGLRHLDVGSGRVRVFALPVETDVRALAPAPDGGLWIGTGRGLFHRDAHATDARAVALPAADAATPVVGALHVDRAGRLWIGTSGHGVFVRAAAGDAAAVAPSSDADAPGRPARDDVRAIVDDGRGVVWLGLRDGTTMRVDTRPADGMHWLRPDPGRAGMVDALFRDRDGRVWIGGARGLGVVDPAPKPVLTLDAGADPSSPAGPGDVDALAATADGRVWAARDGGVDLLDPWIGRVGTIRPVPSIRATARARVLALAAAPDGVWIGSADGLLRAATDGRVAMRVDVPGRAPDLPVASLVVDGARLWLGGPDGLWALAFDAHGRPATVGRWPAERFADLPVTALLRGAGDDLWVGTRAGLSRIDVATGALRGAVAKSPDAGGFRPGDVTSLALDRVGRVWVASDAGGPQVLERPADADWSYRRVAAADGGTWHHVAAVVADAADRLWVADGDGLATVDARTFAVRRLHDADGMTIRDHRQGAVARATTGELFFGGVGGVEVARPALLAPASTGTHASLAITGLRVGDHRLATTAFNRPAGREPARPVTLTPDDRDLFVEFAALDFAASRERRYRHRLVGFDDGWVAGDAGQRLAAYTRLPPGDYTLELAASDDANGAGDAGRFDGPSLALPVRVLPDWYQTTAFRLAAAAVLVAALVALVRAHAAWLVRRDRELEDLIDARDDALDASRDELERVGRRDALTGVANRRRFDEDLKRRVAITARGSRGFVLVLIDLDRFRRINDAFGLDAGDAVLVAVARALERTLRETDTIARLGGDEFACLLREDDDPQAIDATCARLLAALHVPARHGPREVPYRVSIGIARFPEDADDAHALYRRAHAALRHAKRAGGGTWRRHAAQTAQAAAPPQRPRRAAGNA